MTRLQADVTTDLNGLRRFREQVREGLAQKQNPVGFAVLKWGVRVRSFWFDRFIRYSAGGGNWARLKYRVGLILRITDTLLNALQPIFNNAPGAVEEFTEDGIRIGYGGSDAHPDSELSVSELANVHNFGTTTIPRRQIIVNPTQVVLNGMQEDISTGLDELARELDL